MSQTPKLAALIVLTLIVLALAVHGEEDLSKNTFRDVNVNEILDKIQNGEPVAYDHVTVRGDLDIGQLNLPKRQINETQLEIGLGFPKASRAVTSLIRINNSRFDGMVNFDNTTFNEPIDLSGSNFTKEANFKFTIFGRHADFSETPNRFNRSPLEKIFSANFSESAKQIFNGSLYKKFLGLKKPPEVITTADFSKSTFNGKTDFSGSLFEGDADFSRTTFREETVFWDSTFRGVADFSEATFNSTVVFWAGTFDGGANFEGATFLGISEFGEFLSYLKTKFNGYAFFKKATFSNADFRDVIFSNDADFSEAIFNHYADFHRITCSKDAFFWNAKFIQQADFVDATFSKGADFHEATFSGYPFFSGAKFIQQADFKDVTFSNYADFSSSTFNNTANFGYSKFNGPADFISSKFNGTTSFTASVFNKGANFNYVKFNDTTYFDDCQFVGDALFEKANFNKVLSLTKTRYDKLYIRWYNLTDGLYYDDAAYMSLLQNFKNLGYFEDYDNCYFQYRVEHRAQPWPGIDSFEVSIRKFGDVFLQYFYGYGKKPLYPLGWSLFFIGFFAVIWWGVGLNAPLRFSFRAFLSGTKLFVDPPRIPEQTRSSRSLLEDILIVERAIGALFSVLFILAIGATVIR